MSTLSNQEVVHEGWLIKSPPSKRILRARWRRRWFALRQSGELPGQYVLEYYTDRNCRKLKGTIDLDQCEQVDAGLKYEQRKLKYQHMFDIKTPSRTYYLAAETEQDMNSWVECICQVCSLKVYNNDYSEQDIPELGVIASTTAEIVQRPDVEVTEIVEEPEPIENSSYLAFSGPYIPISQCITGKPLNNPSTGQVLMDDMYDFPRTHHTPGNTLTKDSRVPNKHCYNNAAPVFVGNSSEGHVFRYDISPTERSVSQVFRYDFSANAASPTTTATTVDETTDEPASPCSQSSRSTTAMYSNVPSPLLAPNQNTLTPPAVNRELKPKRNLSDSTSIHSLDAAPSVNRRLKPTNLIIKNPPVDNTQDYGEYGNIGKPDRISPNIRPNNDLSDRISLHNLPLDSPPLFESIQYLDLDLNNGEKKSPSCLDSLSSLQISSNSTPRPNSNATVYKTVDFLKTEAFNRTKKIQEEQRKKITSSDE